MIKPLYDIVFIRRIEEEDGLIYMEKDITGMGEVVAVGPGAVLGNGAIVPMEVSVGDKVLFGKYTGIDAGIDDLIAMREDDIIGILH